MIYSYLLLLITLVQNTFTGMTQSGKIWNYHNKHYLKRRHPMNKFSSIFGQILQIFSRIEFQNTVIEFKAEKKAKGFTCWEQFVAMLFCQLGQAHSLREICGGLATCLGKVKHLGIKDAPCLFYLILCERAQTLATLWEDILSTLKQMQTPGKGKEEIPVQEQTLQSWRINYWPLSLHLRLGQVQKDQRCGQTPSSPRSWWIPSCLRQHHRGKYPRITGCRKAHLCSRLHYCHWQGIYGLWHVLPVDRRRGIFCYQAERKRPLPNRWGKTRPETP